MEGNISLAVRLSDDFDMTKFEIDPDRRNLLPYLRAICSLPAAYSVIQFFRQTIIAPVVLPIGTPVRSWPLSSISNCRTNDARSAQEFLVRVLGGGCAYGRLSIVRRSVFSVTKSARDRTTDCGSSP